jgi:chromosome segregation ATPase
MSRCATPDCPHCAGWEKEISAIRRERDEARRDAENLRGALGRTMELGTKMEASRDETHQAFLALQNMYRFKENELGIARAQAMAANADAKHVRTDVIALRTEINLLRERIKMTEEVHAADRRPLGDRVNE